MIKKLNRLEVYSVGRDRPLMFLGEYGDIAYTQLKKAILKNQPWAVVTTFGGYRMINLNNVTQLEIHWEDEAAA